MSPGQRRSAPSADRATLCGTLKPWPNSHAQKRTLCIRTMFLRDSQKRVCSKAVLILALSFFQSRFPSLRVVSCSCQRLCEAAVQAQPHRRAAARRARPWKSSASETGTVRNRVHGSPSPKRELALELRPQQVSASGRLRFSCIHCDNTRLPFPAPKFHLL